MKAVKRATMKATRYAEARSPRTGSHDTMRKSMLKYHSIE